MVAGGHQIMPLGTVPVPGASSAPLGGAKIINSNNDIALQKAGRLILQSLAFSAADNK